MSNSVINGYIVKQGAHAFYKMHVAKLASGLDR